MLELLRARELDLSAIALIASSLTEENRDEILGRVRGGSYREVERVMCEYRPPVALQDRIRPMRVALPGPENIDAVLLEREFARTGHYPRTPGAGSWIDSEQKFFVQFLASEALMEKYEELKALLSHSHPNASFAEVLAVLLNECIERRSPVARQRRREAKKLAVQSGKSSAVGADGDRRFRAVGPARERSRRVPAELRDDVFIRDGNQCTYVAPNGTRCGSTRALEIDHIRPWAAGGTHEPANLRLLCAAHNRLVAEHTLGVHVMERYWRRV